VSKQKYIKSDHFIVRFPHVEIIGQIEAYDTVGAACVLRALTEH
jgi:hypothetical protein